MICKRLREISEASFFGFKEISFKHSAMDMPRRNFLYHNKALIIIAFDSRYVYNSFDIIILMVH